MKISQSLSHRDVRTHISLKKISDKKAEGSDGSFHFPLHDLRNPDCFLYLGDCAEKIRVQNLTGGHGLEPCADCPKCRNYCMGSLMFFDRKMRALRANQNSLASDSLLWFSP